MARPRRTEDDDTVGRVQDKTIPELRDQATGKVFLKDYLVQLDDSSKVPAELEPQQHNDLRASAVARGLRPTGEPKLVKSEAVDARNVHLVYELPVDGAFEDSQQAPAEPVYVDPPKKA